MTVRYFLTANSAQGLVDLQKEGLLGIANVYHLKGESATLIHEALLQLQEAAKKKRLALECIHNANAPDLLWGLVIRELDLAFVSGASASESDKIIHLSHAYDLERLRNVQTEATALRQALQKQNAKTHMHFNAALHIHDEWERIYIDRMDVDLAETFREDLLAKLFDGVPKTGRKPSTVQRFFGASTPDGLTDFIPELTDGLTRYFIKGRPGTGKSTLMRAVLKKASELGYDTDVYRCSLDPKSLDMVVVPELAFCLFDATPPHAHNPTKKNDHLIDTYEAFIKKGTDERCATVLKSIEDKYNNQILSARAALSQADALQKQLEQLYQSAEIASKKSAIFSQLVHVFL